MAIIDPATVPSSRLVPAAPPRIAPDKALQPVVGDGLVECDGRDGQRRGQARHDSWHEPETGSQTIPVFQQQRFQKTSLQIMRLERSANNELRTVLRLMDAGRLDMAAVSRQTPSLETLQALR